MDCCTKSSLRNKSANVCRKCGTPLAANVEFKGNKLVLPSCFISNVTINMDYMIEWNDGYPASMRRGVPITCSDSEVYQLYDDLKELYPDRKLIKCHANPDGYLRTIIDDLIAENLSTWKMFDICKVKVIEGYGTTIRFEQSEECRAAEKSLIHQINKFKVLFYVHFTSEQKAIINKTRLYPGTMDELDSEYPGMNFYKIAKARAKKFMGTYVCDVTSEVFKYYSKKQDETKEKEMQKIDDFNTIALVIEYIELFLWMFTFSAEWYWINLTFNLFSAALITFNYSERRKKSEYLWILPIKFIIHIFVVITTFSSLHAELTAATDPIVKELLNRIFTNNLILIIYVGCVYIFKICNGCM